MMSWKTLPTVLVAFGLLAACGASGRSGAASTTVAPASSEAGPVSVQDGAGYVFQLAHAPSDDGTAVLSAQQAYNAMAGRGQHSTVPIPPTTTALYGYLTEPDTMPPAAQMPVWAFRQDGGCLNTFRGAPANAGCFRWTFARATDGKDLGVVDQQTHS